MAIDRDLVLHLATLARLDLGPEEVEGLTADLARILGYVDELAEVGGADAPGDPARPSNLRSDRPAPGIAAEVALAAAPRTVLGGFAVPGYVDE